MPANSRWDLIRALKGYFKKLVIIKLAITDMCVPGQLSRYSKQLQAGRSGNRIPVDARYSTPVQTGPGVHPASCTMRTGSFPGVKSDRGVTLTPHPLLVPLVMKEQSYISTPLWAVRPAQSLSACIRVHFTFTFLQTCIYGFPGNGSRIPWSPWSTFWEPLV